MIEEKERKRERDYKILDTQCKVPWQCYASRATQREQFSRQFSVITSYFILILVSMDLKNSQENRL